MVDQKSRTNLDPIHNFEGVVAYAEDAKAIDVYCSMANRMGQYVAIREFIIYHRKDLNSILEKHNRQFSQFELINSNFPAYNIQRTLNKEKKYKGVIAIVPSSQENISRIISVSLIGFWEVAVRRLIKKYIYPDALPVYFKQSEISEAFLVLEKALPTGHEIFLSDVVSRQERINQEHPEQRKYDTRRIWTDMPWRNVFGEASENNQLFTGLKFKIKKQGKKIDTTVAAGKIYKYGEIHFDYYYDLINNTFTSLLEERVAQRLSLLQDRGIKERNYHPSVPLEIAFDFDAFENVEAIRGFGKVMAGYPNSAKAVYHGNPYYHANIADFKDGSSFEIWILAVDKIMIVPQAKSSAEAFERLIAYIFSKFHEGKVNEYTVTQ